MRKCAQASTSGISRSDVKADENVPGESLGIYQEIIASGPFQFM